jgi:hypothetical protein
MNLPVDSVHKTPEPPARRPVHETVSRSGHNCKLPIWWGIPFALDPRTYDRADTDLIVRCAGCSALWGVFTPRFSRDSNRFWSELRPSAPLKRFRRLRRVVVFDADLAYQTPDPLTIDWSSGYPRKPDGRYWWQIEFPQMLGAGTNRCASQLQQGYGNKGEPFENTRWVTHRCALKVGHAGSHEDFIDECVYVGWS